MDDEQRIRERAYHLWEQDGRPEGREVEYWDRARFLVGIEGNPEAGTLPNPSIPTVQNPGGTAPAVTSEPIEAVRNLGEFPGLADQGEKMPMPAAPEKQDNADPQASDANSAASRKRSKKTPSSR